MEGELEPRWQRDPARLRVSDTDRHQVAEILRQAAGEGRIDLAELDERLEATYAAKTYADLVPLTVDLPVRGRPRCPLRARSRPGRYPPCGPSRLDDRRPGRGQPPGRLGARRHHTAFAMMAGIDLDLREARFTQRETVIYANAFWAGIDIMVNEFTHVIVDGIGILGGFDHARDKVAPVLGPDSPTVRVKGVALMAGVTVQRRPMPGPPRRRSLHRRH